MNALGVKGPVEAEVGSQASEGEHQGPEGETLAVDRAIACHLLQIVYDASPLVRAEVALSLSRLISGHNVLFQVRKNPRNPVLHTRGPCLPTIQLYPK